MTAPSGQPGQPREMPLLRRGHGITWYRDARTAMVPAGMTDHEAVEIWQRILDRFPAWVSGVVGEAREGRS